MPPPQGLFARSRWWHPACGKARGWQKSLKLRRRLWGLQCRNSSCSCIQEELSARSSAIQSPLGTSHKHLLSEKKVQWWCEKRGQKPSHTKGENTEQISVHDTGRRTIPSENDVSGLGIHSCHLWQITVVLDGKLPGIWQLELFLNICPPSFAKRFHVDHIHRSTASLLCNLSKKNLHNEQFWGRIELKNSPVTSYNKTATKKKTSTNSTRKFTKNGNRGIKMEGHRALTT